MVEIGCGNLELGDQQIHEALVASVSPKSVVHKWPTFEVDDIVSDFPCVFFSSGVWAYFVERTGEHGNGHFVDSLDRNQGCLNFTLCVVWSPLLEPVLHMVVAPMKVVMH